MCIPLADVLLYHCSQYIYSSNGEQLF